MRVIPKESKPGVVLAPAWQDVPAPMRASLRFPDWPMPTDLRRWVDGDRQRTHAMVLALLGELAPRPDPRQVRTVSTEDKGEYLVERFEFHNGVDTVVPGMLLRPKGLTRPAPAVLALHHYGSCAANPCVNPEAGENVGLPLVKRGFVVAAIDSYFHGERIGRGPGGVPSKSQEQDLFKLYLWTGRSLWGMMLRDQQCVLDYLQSRPEVDGTRLGATGCSMGCTGAWWLAGVDERVAAVAGVACFTRYQELIAHGYLPNHPIYYYAPNMLKHFDSEAVHALIAPRPHLELCGDQDQFAPADGIEVLEAKLSALYQLYGKPEHFRSLTYEKTGHTYLPEMKEQVVQWFETHLKLKV